MNRITAIIIGLAALSSAAQAQEPDRQFEAALAAALVSSEARTFKGRDDGLALFSPQGWNVESQQQETKQMPGGVVMATATYVIFSLNGNQCTVHHGNEPTRENPPSVLRNAVSAVYRIGSDRSSPAHLGFVSFGGREAAYSKVVAANRQGQVVRVHAYRDRRFIQVTCNLRQLASLGVNDEPATQDAYRIINGAIWP